MQRGQLLVLLLLLLALLDAIPSNLLLAAAARPSPPNRTRAINSTAGTRGFTFSKAAAFKRSPSPIIAFSSHLNRYSWNRSTSSSACCRTGHSSRRRRFALSSLSAISDWQEASPAQQRLLLRQKLLQLQRQREEYNGNPQQEQRQRYIDHALNQEATQALASVGLPPVPQDQHEQQHERHGSQHHSRQQHHPKSDQQQTKEQSVLPPLPPVDVAVLGGGHAGVEAAVAASRLGLTAALISPHGFDSVGLLSCNPSIGGSGKSHLVCETDACGGLIGRAADIAAVHWRVLNVSRGPAAWAPRVQVDRVRFARCIRRLLSVFSSITVVDAAAEEILTEQQQSQQHQQACQQQRVWGVKLRDGRELQASAVVVATGTFLDAAVAVGSCKAAGGRMHSVAESAATAQRPHEPQQQHHQQQQLPIQAIADVEPSAKGLAASLQKLGLRTAYFKTGTPARLLGSSIDFEKLQRQPSDPTPRPFSAVHTPQQMRARRGGWIDCFLGKTGDKTREIVQQYAHTLPRHREDDGRGVGPRYCPSIANKVRLFPHNPFHIVWLEPEDSSLSIIYPGGLSGAFPPAVQQELLHSIPGLDRATPIRYAYDVEYLVVKGTDVATNLEAKTVGGLFLAGQVLGTTGYEEAAALGLLAGWNAGLYALAQRKATRVKRSKPEPLAPEAAESAAGCSSTSAAGSSRSSSSHVLPQCIILNPAKSMTGAVAEQLTARDATEPLRAFAARVTSRLSMRCDNAAERMLPEVLHGGLFYEDHPRAKRARRRVADVKALVELIRQFELPASRWRVLIDRAICTLEEQQQQQDIAGQDSTKTTFPAEGAARQPGPVAAAAAPVADRQHRAYVQFIEAPHNLLLLGLRCWESAVGNGGRRWSAAQLLAALPPALAKLEQGGLDTPESQTTDTPQGSCVNATSEKTSAACDKSLYPSTALNPSVQRGKEERQQGRDCVALQLLVALILDELTRQYSSNSSNGGSSGSAVRMEEGAQWEHLDLLSQQGGESGLLPLLFRCLSPSFGGHIASTVYAEVRYSFYFQREAREVAATESEDLIPTDLSMEKHPFLCREELDCLRRFRPRTFKEAARLGCLRPASALQLMRNKRLSQSKRTVIQEQEGQ